MSKVTFITGNPKKAEFLEKFLGYKVEHKELNLDEIQSLDLKKIAEHKAKQGFEIVHAPVLVEDVGVVINALGRLPGPFIKWFEKELGLDGIIKLLKKEENRRASVSICYVYYDGETTKYFEDSVTGTIADEPKYGEYDFGWNPIFIPHDSEKTFAQMDSAEMEQYSLRTRKVYPELKKFLSQLDKQ